MEKTNKVVEEVEEMTIISSTEEMMITIGVVVAETVVEEDVKTLIIKLKTKILMDSDLAKAQSQLS